MLKYLQALNDSKFLMGVVMLLINVGSKYIELGLSRGQEAALRDGLAREILIFAMVFMGTRDVLISILMTAAFTILSGHLLNENSKFCVIPVALRKLGAAADIDGDKIVSPEEERKAVAILERAKKNKRLKQQRGFVSYLDAGSFGTPYEPFI